MIKIKKLNLPENYSEITLEQLQRIMQYKDSFQEKDSIEKIIEILSPGFDVYSLNVTEYLTVVTTIYSMLSAGTQDLTPVSSFVIDGKTYKVKNVDEINVKEFIDFENIASELSDAPENVSLLISLVTDNGGKGDYTTRIKKNAVKFEQLDACTALGVVIFFVEGLTRLSLNTTISSEQRK